MFISAAAVVTVAAAAAAAVAAAATVAGTAETAAAEAAAEKAHMNVGPQQGRRKSPTRKSEIRRSPHLEVQECKEIPMDGKGNGTREA